MSVNEAAIRVSAEATEEGLIEARVVGVTFEGRQAVVAQLKEGEPIILRREWDNPYDASAIRVERMDGAMIGYLSRGLAAQLRPQMDQRGGQVIGEVALVVGGYAPWASWGVRIRFGASVPASI